MSHAEEVNSIFQQVEQRAARAESQIRAAEAARDAAARKAEALDRASKIAGEEIFLIRRAATVVRGGEAGAIVEVLGSTGPAWLTRQGIAAVIEAGSLDTLIFGIADVEARLDDELSFLVLLTGGGKLIAFLNEEDALAFRAWAGRATAAAMARVAKAS